MTGTAMSEGTCAAIHWVKVWGYGRSGRGSIPTPTGEWQTRGCSHVHPSSPGFRRTSCKGRCPSDEHALTARRNSTREERTMSKQKDVGMTNKEWKAYQKCLKQIKRPKGKPE